MRRIWLFLFSIFMISACGKAQDVHSTPSLMPGTVYNLGGSQEATLKIPNRDLLSTPTPEPESTQTRPTPTLKSATVTPQQTSRSLPTQERPDQEVISPDAKWIAKIYEDYWHSFSIQVIEIEDASGEIAWVYPYQGTMPRGDPHPTMRIYGWVPDSTRVYFYYVWGYDGWYTLFKGDDLQAIDIETGDLSVILNGTVDFAFFSDMSKIAYVKGNLVGIYDIATSEDRHVKIKSNSLKQAGYIHLSPSESGLVYTVLLDMDNARAIYLDLGTMKQTVLFDAFIEDFWFDEWTKDENPQFFMRTKGSEDEESFDVVQIDRKTAEMLVIGTPTPQP